MTLPSRTGSPSCCALLPETEAMPKKVMQRKVKSGVLLAELRELILAAREGVARTVNTGLVIHCWEIGRRIRASVLRKKRAEYGLRLSLRCRDNWPRNSVLAIMRRASLAWSNSRRYSQTRKLSLHCRDNSPATSGLTAWVIPGTRSPTLIE